MLDVPSQQALGSLRGTASRNVVGKGGRKDRTPASSLHMQYM